MRELPHATHRHTVRMAKGSASRLMLRCSTCGLLRPLSEYPRRADRPSGRGTICLPCGRAYQREHYARNKPYYLDKAHLANKRQRARAADRLIEYLASHACVDCGEHDIRVLQFDHVDPSLKTANVADLVRRGAAWTRISREIALCAVRCGNCHRRKTLLELLSRRGGDGWIREDPGRWIVAGRDNGSSGR